MPLNATTEPICFSENRAVFINLKDEVEFFIKVMNFHPCLVAIKNSLLYAEIFKLLLLGLWFAYTFDLLKNDIIVLGTLGLLRIALYQND